MRVVLTLDAETRRVRISGPKDPAAVLQILQAAIVELFAMVASRTSAAASEDAARGLVR